MKKFLSILLILVLALGVFAACQEPVVETPAATLDDAKTYLAELYKESNPKPEKDYDVVGKVIVNGVTFTVTWTSSISEVTIKESTKKDFYTVDLPDANAEAKEYVLTATITDAEGATATVEVKKTLPVFENVAGAATVLEEGAAYKLFFDQKSVGKVLFLLAEATTAENKYIKTTTDPKAAPDFFVEKVDDGYKIYTMIGETKTYIRAATTKSDDGKISKYLGFDTTGTVFKYNENYGAWYTTIDNINYVMGTYSTYETASISDDSYYKTEENRATQYPVTFIAKAEAEAMTPSEEPEDPTEYTSIADALAIAATKDHNTYTVEKYLIKGTITEIKNAEYGNLYIADDAGNSIYVYGMYNADGTVRFDKMDPQPKVGDVVTLMSIIGQYNDTPQLKNAWVVDLVAFICEHNWTAATCTAPKTCSVCGATEGEALGHVDENTDNKCDRCEFDMSHTCADANGDYVCDTEGCEKLVLPEAGSTLTIAQATALGLAMGHNTYTTDKYYVEGKIDEVYNTQYGNMYLVDADGNQFTIYGTYNADGQTGYGALTNKPVAGDTVKIYGIIGAYNDKAQIKNGWIVEHTPAAGGEQPGGETGGETGGEATLMTIPQVLAADVNTSVIVKGTVESFYRAWSDQYNNCSPYIVDAEGNKLLCYNLATKVNVGDQITVTGVVGEHNSVKQVAAGCTAVIDVAHTHNFADATCTAPKTCSCGAIDGTALDHIDENSDNVCDRTGCGADLTPATPGQNQTASIVIADYAAANSWANSTMYNTITSGVVTITANHTATSASYGANTGKYYTNGENWRIYQSEAPELTISVASGTIVSVKVSYASQNTGTLTLNGQNVATDTVVNVNAASITFSVGNTGDATNGQARITAIEVVYN